MITPEILSLLKIVLKIGLEHWTFESQANLYLISSNSCNPIDPAFPQVDPEALDRMMEGTRQYLRRNTVKLDRLVARLLKPRSVWESLLVRGKEFNRKWTM